MREEMTFGAAPTATGLGMSRKGSPGPSLRSSSLSFRSSTFTFNICSWSAASTLARAVLSTTSSFSSLSYQNIKNHFFLPLGIMWDGM